MKSETKKNIFLDMPYNVGVSNYLPSSVHLLLNDKCNAKCVFCGGNYFNSLTGRMMTLDKFKIIANNIHMEHFRQVVLAGAGDPLLCPDFVPIMEHLQAMYPAVGISVTTNGIALNREISEAMLACGVTMLNISLNAATQETYQRLMQVDAFDKICQQLRDFSALCWGLGRGPNLQLSIPIMRCNVEELPLLIKFAHEVGARTINVFYCRFYPREIRNDKDGALLPDKESLFFYQDLSDRIVRESEQLALDLGIQLLHEPLFSQGCVTKCCSWTEKELMIGFDGEVFPCGGGELHFKKRLERGEYDFGNALNQTIDEFWNNDSYRAIRLSSKRDGKCIISECSECSNMTSHMEQRGHILEWADFSNGGWPDASTSSPLISVIVPTHNRPEMLKEAIQSILDQTNKDFEIIVVNDAGQDVSSVVQTFNSLKITYLSHETNKGLAAARNTGIRSSRGRYIAYLDDDDIFYPDHLETLVVFLQESGEKAAYTDAFRAHQHLQGDRYMTYYKDIPYSHDFDNDRILYKNFVPVLCFMHEKACLDRCGVFDETFTRLEDWELWLRMSRDFTIHHIRSLTCEFRYRPDGSSMVSGSLAKFLSMTQRLFLKHPIGAEELIYGKRQQHLSALRCDTDRQLLESMETAGALTADEFVASPQYESLLRSGASREMILSSWYHHLALLQLEPGISEQFLNLSLEMDQSNHSARSALCSLLLRRKRLEEVAPHLEKLLQASPEDETIRQLAAEMERICTIKIKPPPKYGSAVKPITIAVFSLDLPEQACSQLRFYGVRGALAEQIDILWGTYFDIQYGQLTTFTERAEQADIIVIARLFPRKETAVIIERLFALKKPVVYDVDDLLTALPVGNPFKEQADQSVPFIENVARRASLVTVSNQCLKHEMSGYNTNVIVLPNLLDQTLWGRVVPAEQSDSPVVIGYAGGFTHTDDLHIIEDALLAIAEKFGNKIAFKFMGCVSDRLRTLSNYEYLEASSNYGTYAQTLRHEQIDIALAPLVDNRFNRCKSNIKWLEYSACGCAGIFSDLPPYNSCIQNGVTGLLVENTTESWVNAIEQLISDPELCRSIAENAKQQVMANHTLLSGAHKYMEAYSSLITIEEPVQNSNSAPKVNEVVGRGTASLTSIIILTWNQLSFTQACLSSIAEHTPEPYELIVIDNCSSDGTLAWLHTRAALDSRIAVIENTVNRGFAAGCNQGIAAANGDFILLLNNDTVVTEGWLSGMREPLERYPDAGIIGPMTNSASGVQVVSSVGYTSLDELDAFATSFRADYRYRIIPQRRVVGFCMLFRRELVEKVGLLDESFGSGNFEDDDYCLRAELAGYRNLIVGDVFVHHFGGATFTGNHVDYSQAMMKNLLTFKKKWALENLEESTLRRWLVLSAIEKAQSLFQEGFIPEAVENLLQKGIRSDTTCGRPYIALAEMLISAGRYEEALQILPEMPMEVERSLVNEIESVCYAALGEDAASARAAHLATEKGINRARAWNVIGTLAVRQADVAGAEQYFQHSIAADPSCGAGWFSLGMLLWGKSDQEAAWHAISKAVLLEPLAGESVRIYCDMALRLGRMKEAIKLISEISHTYPDCRALALVKSEILANCDNVAEALESCETFLVRFGADDSLLRVGCELRRNSAVYDRCVDGETESISLCLIVKNEEENISRCLASAKPVVHEIVVVDTGSTDRTVEIAELFGAKISSFPWNGNFSDARNSALSKATGAWILVLDADEVLSAKDFSHIRQAVHESSGKKVAWSVLTRNYTHLHSQGWVANDGAYLAEERSNGWHPSWKVRLFPNDPDLHFVGGVHEMIEPTAQRFGYQVREASFVVHHYGGLADTAAGDRAKKETYYELGKQKLAERPDNISAIGELAVQAAELELYEEAIKLWNRFLELAPDAAVALFNKGFALMRLNRFAEALDVTRRALEVDSCHKEAAFNYGVCALYSGDPHEAITRLESTLQKHAAHPPLLAILTLLYLISGQREKAAFTYSKLKALNYAITDFAKARADVLLGLGKEDLAKKLLDECAAIGMDVY